MILPIFISQKMCFNIVKKNLLKIKTAPLHQKCSAKCKIPLAKVSICDDLDEFANVCKSDSLHSLSSVSRRSQAIKCHGVSNTLDPFGWFQQIFVTRNSSGPRAIPRSSSAGIEALFNPLQLQVLTKHGWITSSISQSVVRYWSMLLVYPSWTQPVKVNVSPVADFFFEWTSFGWACFCSNCASQRFN